MIQFLQGFKMTFFFPSFFYFFSQENGHAKTNGDASPAAEDASKADVQVNGSTPTEEAPKEGGENVEGAEAKGEKEPAATNGEASAKPEEGTPSTSEEGKQKKKRFSFKKPSFKLSGFSFKKTKKESEEGAAAGEEETTEGEKAPASEEAPAEEKPADEGAEKAAAEEPKSEEGAKAQEEAAAPEAGEEKPAVAPATEPETAAVSPEAPAAAATAAE